MRCYLHTGGGEAADRTAGLHALVPIDAVSTADPQEANSARHPTDGPAALSGNAYTLGDWSVLGGQDLLCDLHDLDAIHGLGAEQPFASAVVSQADFAGRGAGYQLITFLRTAAEGGAAATVAFPCPGCVAAFSSPHHMMSAGYGPPGGIMTLAPAAGAEDRGDAAASSLVSLPAPVANPEAEGWDELGWAVDALAAAAQHTRQKMEEIHYALSAVSSGGDGVWAAHNVMVTSGGSVGGVEEQRTPAGTVLTSSASHASILAAQAAGEEAAAGGGDNAWSDHDAIHGGTMDPYFFLRAAQAESAAAPGDPRDSGLISSIQARLLTQPLCHSYYALIRYFLSSACVLASATGSVLCDERVVASLAGDFRVG